MDPRDFARLADLVRRVAGIQLTVRKRAMVEGRLFPRLRELGLRTLGQYLDRVESQDGGGEELEELINRITTNVTEFFRVPQQFEFLERYALPRIMEDRRREGERIVRIWSAGCASGQEPYSIAMVVAKVVQRDGPWDVKILATDIARGALRAALAGVYPLADLEQIPEPFRQRFTERLDDAHFVIRSELRKLVLFRKFNLLSQQYPLRRDIDAVFFRNVAIYFGRQERVHVLERIVDHIRVGGYLFLGPCENLHPGEKRLMALGHATYVKRRE